MKKYYIYLIKIIKMKLHNYKNKRYWTKYYKLHRENIEPSSFAVYCCSKYCKENKDKYLLELGCGNARDSIYFMRQNLNVLGLDIVQEEIEYLQRKNLSKNLKFLCADFCNYSKSNSYDYIFSRFTFHTIKQEQEILAIKNSYNNLKNNGLLFIEVRSIKDNMFKISRKISSNEGETDHYRRFIVFDDFVNQIKSSGFEIVEAIEQSGLARYKDDDPIVIRIIAKKN